MFHLRYIMEPLYLQDQGFEAFEINLPNLFIGDL